jgi:hypothetical protein
MKKGRRDIMPPLAPADRVSVRHALYGYRKGYNGKAGEFIWVGAPETYSAGPLKGEMHLLARDDASALADFATLAEAEFRTVFAFAARYGHLPMCEQHQLPTGHGPIDDVAPHESCVTTAHLQSTDRYRYFAKSARALLNIAEALRAFETAKRYTNWSSIVTAQRLQSHLDFLSKQFLPEVWGRNPAQVDSISMRERIRLDASAEAQDALWYGVTWWLVIGRLHPVLRMPPVRARPTLELSGHGLWGTLARQLSARVVRLDEVNLVSLCKGGCGRDAPVRESDRRGRPREYCDECDPAAVRQRRKRLQRKLVDAHRRRRK